MKKKNKKLIMYIIGLVAIVGAVWLASSIDWNKDAGNAYSASAILALENYYDFGQVQMYEGNVKHNFELKNDGQEPVVINKVYTSCMCTQAVVYGVSGKKEGEFGMPGHGLPSKTYIEVGSGETINVEAIFDPAAHGPAGVGLAERSIYLETNSQINPKVELRFKAMVVR